jgi:hypothetical protein
VEYTKLDLSAKDVKEGCTHKATRIYSSQVHRDLRATK